MKAIVAGLLMLVLALDVIAQTTRNASNFGDEDEAIPSWTEDLKDQAVDLAMFTAFATLALVSFFRKSERLKWITMAAAVLYLGFARSQLITIVNVFGLIEWNLPVFRHNMTWYLFAIFTVVTTILWGRLYCGRVCAFGAMTQLLDKIVPARLRFEVPSRIDRRASYIKYGLLGGTVLYFLVTKNISIPVTCCMPQRFGSGFGQKGSTLNSGAPLESTACLCRCCARWIEPAARIRMQPITKTTRWLRLRCFVVFMRIPFFGCFAVDAKDIPIESNAQLAPSGRLRHFV